MGSEGEGGDAEDEGACEDCSCGAGVSACMLDVCAPAAPAALAGARAVAVLLCVGSKAKVEERSAMPVCITCVLEHDAGAE